MKKVTIYTDGSCIGNPGPGGWAALFVFERDGKRHEKMITGGEKDTTNNRMELRAALEALQALKEACEVEIVTDSNYMVQAMTSWIYGWQKRDWKNSKKKPVENRDLFEALWQAQARHDVKWTWVKAHAGHPENERVDDAARAAAEAQR